MCETRGSEKLTGALIYPENCFEECGSQGKLGKCTCCTERFVSTERFGGFKFYRYISTCQFLPCNFHKSYPAFVCTTMCHLSLKNVPLLTRNRPNAQHHDNDNDNDNSAPTCFKRTQADWMCMGTCSHPAFALTCRRINSQAILSSDSTCHCMADWATFLLCAKLHEVTGITLHLSNE